jgi:hypothetical protein
MLVQKRLSNRHAQSHFTTTYFLLVLRQQQVVEMWRHVSHSSFKELTGAKDAVGVATVGARDRDP